MIKVLFQTESHFPVSRKKIRAAVVAELGKTVKSDTEVSISVVGDRRMHELNKTYHHVDATTDVLSFPQNDPTQPLSTPFVESPDQVLRLGDIVVSYPQAVIDARKMNTLVDDAVIMLVLHGLNHLMGKHHPE